MNHHKVEHGFLCGFTTGESFEFIVNGLDGAEGETITFKLSESEYHLSLADCVANNLKDYIKSRREAREKKKREEEERRAEERRAAMDREDLLQARNMARTGLTARQRELLAKHGMDTWQHPKSS